MSVLKIKSTENPTYCPLYPASLWVITSQSMFSLKSSYRSSTRWSSGILCRSKSGRTPSAKWLSPLSSLAYSSLPSSAWITRKFLQNSSQISALSVWRVLNPGGTLKNQCSRIQCGSSISWLSRCTQQLHSLWLELFLWSMTVSSRPLKKLRRTKLKRQKSYLKSRKRKNNVKLRESDVKLFISQSK